MSGWAEVCHCGHDKTTHFEARGSCLGVHCNDCQIYVHRDDPDRPERAKPTKVTVERETPYPRFVTPVTHPTWCTCPVCFP